MHRYHLRGRLAAQDNSGCLDQGRTLLNATVTAVNFLRHGLHIACVSEGVAPVCFPEPASGTGCDSLPEQQFGLGNQIQADAASAGEVIIPEGYLQQPTPTVTPAVIGGTVTESPAVNDIGDCPLLFRRQWGSIVLTAQLLTLCLRQAFRAGSP